MVRFELKNRVYLIFELRLDFFVARFGSNLVKKRSDLSLVPLIIFGL